MGGIGCVTGWRWLMGRERCVPEQVRRSLGVRSFFPTIVGIKPAPCEQLHEINKNAQR